METRLTQLKVEFNSISDIRKQVKNFFDILEQRINRLKQFHSEFVKQTHSEMFVFGLDSLNFQSKLIDIEFDDMKRIFLAISNRMYCEYFKLYKMIVTYISENAFDKKIMELVKGTNFPVYKDLEPYKEYDFDVICDMHESILLLIQAILGYLEGKEHELQFHLVKQSIGLNINNFISSFRFDMAIIREQVNLFVSYMEFFHKLHVKQLQRLSHKIQLMYNHVNKDINFDESLDFNARELNEDKSSETLSSSENSMEDEMICQAFNEIETMCDKLTGKEEEEPPGLLLEEISGEVANSNTIPEEFSKPFVSS
jgi:hypothetical protein